MRALFLLAAGVLLLSPSRAEEVRFHGVLIRVPDVERAIAFYGGVMGFDLQRREVGLAVLRDSTPIYLEQTDAALVPPAEDEARSSVAFLTKDLAATTRAFRAKGVQFLREEPGKVGVGIANRFLDPFGNNHALIQQTIAEPPPFEEPEVYNSGFKIADRDTNAMRRLFIEVLGLTARTEKYYPPSLPIGHKDGTLAFMVHENEAFEPEVRPRGDPKSAAVSLVLATDDLDATRRRLLAAGFDQLGPIRPFSMGVRMTLITPAGVPMEFWKTKARAGSAPGG